MNPLGGQSQEELEFKASLGYTWRLYLNQRMLDLVAQTWNPSYLELGWEGRVKIQDLSGVESELRGSPGSSVKPRLQIESSEVERLPGTCRVRLEAGEGRPRAKSSRRSSAV